MRERKISYFHIKVDETEKKRVGESLSTVRYTVQYSLVYA